MRRLIFLAVMSMLGTLVLAPAALAQDDDLNCDDFATAADATAAMRPGDPDNLDANDNGIACEDSLPAGGDDSTSSATSTTATSEADDDSATATPSAEADDDSATPTATSTADSSASASALPATGGSPLVFGLAPLALLVGGAVVALGLVRRK